MKRIKSQSDKPWIMVGDFNETMWQFEHFSSTKRGERQMEAFREALEFCGMHDLGFVGLPWTFDNKQFGRRNVRVRLDRAVADDNWSNLFDQASVEHLVSPCSDHCPILLRLAPADAQGVKPKILRYEIMWEREQSLGDVIMEAWDSGPTKTSLASFASALKGVMQSLHSWSRENFGSVRRKLEELRTRLAELNGKMDDDSRAEARRTAAVMDEMLYREEMMWLQRSRISWLREGDRNTKFFHQKAIWRSRKNRIKRLKADNGQWCDDPSVMASMAEEFFRSLYSRDDGVDSDSLTSIIEERVSEDMNTQLCKEFTDEEIGDALFQIGPLKALGPDGFPARFLQRNWLLMKNDVIQAIKAFFADGVMPQEVNETAIVLIPKVAHPEQLSEFRPISLCNVIYKVVSKCLVNRLRAILQDIISPNQSAFIPGRLITDNALIAFECLHAIQSSTSASTNFCAYKLDLSKAYDRVDWSFFGKNDVEAGFCKFLGTVDHGLCYFRTQHSSLQWGSIRTFLADTWSTPGRSTFPVLIFARR